MQFQDVRVAPVISEREGAEQRVRLSLARCSWARKAGVNPEYEAFSSVSAGNSASGDGQECGKRHACGKRRRN